MPNSSSDTTKSSFRVNARDSTFLFVICSGLAFPAWARTAEPTVHVPSAQTAKVLQHAIDACRAAGGGTVVLESGTHLLDRPLYLRDAAHINLIGQEHTHLKVAPQREFVAAAACGEGQAFVPVQQAARTPASGIFEVQAPGRTDPTPGTEILRQIPYFDIAISEVVNARLILAKPLPYPVPKGTRIVSAYNAIEIVGVSRDIRLENLSVEGNRIAWPMPPRNHSRHCGIFVAGEYSWRTGPTTEPIRRVTIVRCTVRDFHHRGMALYSVADSRINKCTVEETGAEAIDLDHFVQRCRVVDCKIRRGAVGVELNDAAHCTVGNVTIDDCPIGIKVWKWCLVDGWNTDNSFTGNTILHANDTGIVLAKGTTRSRIVGNMLIECGTGVRHQGDAAVLKGNHFRDCQVDIER